MDSNIALALMAKARRAFEHEGVFLSFPVAPVQFSKDDLAQINSATTGAGLARAADFSRLVNAIPEGVVWMPGSDRPLWSTHRRVLKGPETVLAQGSLSPGQEEALRIAAEVLSGDKFAAYSQYRAGWDALKNRYQLAKADADLSTDAALKSKWRDQTEPDLRLQIQVLEFSWATLGFRTEVESALRTEQTLGRSIPVLVWQDWSNACADVAFQTDPAGQEFAVTGFSPTDVWSGSWMSFSIAPDQVRGLIAEAPQELRARLATDSVDLRVEELSFECASVQVLRPWFDSGPYEARFWKFTDPGLHVCDGQTPAKGLAPAYVTGLILGRNLRVKLAPNTPQNKPAMDRLATSQFLSLGVAKISAPAAVAPGQVMMLRRAVDAAPAAPASVNLKPTPAVLHASPAMFSAVSPMVMAHPAITTMAGHTVAAHPAVPAAGVHGALAAHVMMSPALGGIPPRRPEGEIDPKMMLLLRRQSFTALKIPALTPPPKPPDPVPDTSAFVLAFVCRRLPLCPDPDPSLTW